MKPIAPLIIGMLLLAGTALADDLKDASAKVTQLSDRLAKLSSGKVLEYAKPQLDTAQGTLGAMKAAISAGNGKLALQTAELADVQMTIAEAKAAEQESTEQVVLRRAELRKLDGQFDQLLQPGGK